MRLTNNDLVAKTVTLRSNSHGMTTISGVRPKEIDRQNDECNMASELETQAEELELEETSDVEPFISSDTDDLSQIHEISASNLRGWTKDNGAFKANDNSMRAAYVQQQVEDGSALDDRA